MNHVHLGASLYIPATRSDVLEIANGQRYDFLRSMIFCTEDAVRTGELEAALENLREALPQFAPREALRFLRVRNPQVMARVLEMEGCEALDGFVLPKITATNLHQYLELLGRNDHFAVMPTLETADVFDYEAMKRLRDAFLEPEARRRILSVRIGGNDLLHLVGARRSRKRTAYDLPLGRVISMLTGIFSPYGFNLTAPVFEGLSDPALLREEVERDLEHGLFGKTAIHPSQVPMIESVYQVEYEDYEMALAMMQEDCPAVFRMHDTLCEVATHLRWAEGILERARIYGVRSEGAIAAEGLA